jgi:5-methylcytosine-specific restriction endonuclease McrA
MQLKSVSNSELYEEFKKLMQLENRTKVQIVEYVREIERRKLYIEHGYTSLFSFLTKGMGYAVASAQRRMDSARLLEAVPNLKEDLESGALNLTQVSMVAQSIRQKRKEEPGAKLNAEDKQELLNKIKNQDGQETQKILAQELNLEIKEYEKQKIQRDESLRLEITLSKEDAALFKRVRDLISHQNPSPTWAEVMAYLAKDFLKRKDPLQKKPASGSSEKTVAELVPNVTNESGPAAAGKATSNTEFTSGAEVIARQELRMKQHAGQNPKQEPNRDQDPCRKPNLDPNQQPVQARSENPRAISAAVRSEVFQRDECCRWNHRGKPCCSTFQLQVDHRIPVWAGGGNEIENLQLLCAFHNRMKYKLESGMRV